MGTNVTGTIAESVINWYSNHQRDLPWRKSRNPYFIWISEVMLQQTQVETVIPFYERFLSRFPTIDALSRASLHEILKVWENMGYYSRAHNLCEAAKIISEQYDGQIPNNMEALQGLPGVGNYTASAILCFAFGRQVPTVDGNVRRVLCRLYGIKALMDQTSTKKRLFDIATKLVPKKRSSHFNQGLMDLGATVCTPRKPCCNPCPLNNHCQALKLGLQDTLPKRVKRAPLPNRQMTAGIITDAQRRLLIVQRPMKGLLGGLWKFRGGERKADETLKDALKRTVREEVGIRIKVKEDITSVNHAYTHFRMTLYAFRCVRQGGKPAAMNCINWKWIKPRGLRNYPFSKGDRKIIKAIPDSYSVT